MKKNMGTLDRSIRLVLGIIIAALGIYYESWWGLLALPLLITSVVRVCPAYLPLGLNTCKTREE